ncbi:thyroglobulin-like isoform X2 [Salvelinus fontinalis]|uniref:thyroglobulin-like isoform X2 n=1 Tax=Salvelinus fontinalis TaxID=8038 RepID=UPI002485271E|nr:thyroglobulin-like isoform X2 [Salvelinus fontinalis]
MKLLHILCFCLAVLASTWAETGGVGRHRNGGITRPKTPCERARDAVKNGLIGADIPTCDDDVEYTHEQCSGSTGYCWCVNSSGQKVPGTETRPGTARINCATQNGMMRPKTPCEIARDTAMKIVRLGVYVPTCDNDGQYTPEQCRASTGYCWCVNSTGQKIQGTETPPGTAIINCATQNGMMRPKTPCEIARDTAMKIVRLGVYVPTCDNDGQYTPEQCRASTGYCWCVNSTGQKIQGTETPPGTAIINCATQNGMMRPKTPCEIARDTAMKIVRLGVYVPTCDNDGQYTPEQCRASTGYCWCVNSTGQKILGTETLPGTARINCATQNGMMRPKTPCEIARDTAMKIVRLGVYVPTCDNDGQYTPEQCRASTGYCWCVNSTGQKIQGTETPPGTAIINCATQNGMMRPKTPCEIARDTAMKIVRLGVYVPTCDNDGQYTPEQCRASTGYCWCVNSTGQKIQGTETPPGTAIINCATQNGMIRPKTPCEIARDTAMKIVRLGVYVPTCDNDGQYTPEQCRASTGYCWCVNSSGQKILGTETPPGTARINCATQRPIGEQGPIGDATQDSRCSQSFRDVCPAMLLSVCEQFWTEDPGY